MKVYILYVGFITHIPKHPNAPDMWCTTLWNVILCSRRLYIGRVFVGLAICVKHVGCSRCSKRVLKTSFLTRGRASSGPHAGTLLWWTFLGTQKKLSAAGGKEGEIPSKALLKSVYTRGRQCRKDFHLKQF